MVDAVDKLMSELRSACAKEQIVRSHHVIYAQEAIATLRAELEQVKRERDDAQRAAAFQENNWRQERDLKLGLVEALRAAERLAGARVVTRSHVEAEKEAREIAAAARKLVRNTVDAIAVDELVSRRVLSALAEPAGEAEPCQFLPTEDGEFNGNTTETPIAAEDGREVDWIDVIGWGLYKGHAIPVDVARYIATKINLYAEHRTTPPDASAIRGALGPVPTHECSFRIGQPVQMASHHAEDDPSTVYYVTGIRWEHRQVLARGWDITIATADDLKRGYGQTDGFAPSDLRAALAGAKP